MLSRESLRKNAKLYTLRTSSNDIDITEKIKSSNITATYRSPIVRFPVSINLSKSSIKKNDEDKCFISVNIEKIKKKKEANKKQSNFNIYKNSIKSSLSKDLSLNSDYVGNFLKIFRDNHIMIGFPDKRVVTAFKRGNAKYELKNPLIKNAMIKKFNKNDTISLNYNLSAKNKLIQLPKNNNSSLANSYEGIISNYNKVYENKEKIEAKSNLSAPKVKYNYKKFLKYNRENQSFKHYRESKDIDFLNNKYILRGISLTKEQAYYYNECKNVDLGVLNTEENKKRKAEPYFTIGQKTCENYKICKDKNNFKFKFLKTKTKLSEKDLLLRKLNEKIYKQNFDKRKNKNKFNSNKKLDYFYSLKGLISNQNPIKVLHNDF